jgi:hypothetical protein
MLQIGGVQTRGSTDNNLLARALSKSHDSKANHSTFCFELLLSPLLVVCSGLVL